MGLRNKFICATIGLGILAGSVFAIAPAIAPDMNIADTFTPRYAAFITRDALSGLLDPNVPKIVNLKKNRCSGYAMRAAGYIVGAEYVPADAWDLGDENETVWTGHATSLEELLSSMEESGEVLREGDILGIYNPASQYLEEGRDFTHAVMYAGNGTILQQDGYPVLKSKLDKYIRYSNWNATAIGLDPKYAVVAVFRAPEEEFASQNNTFMLKKLFPGFYRSVEEPSLQ